MRQYIDKLIALHQSVGTQLSYTLGSKIVPLSLQAPEFKEHNVTAVDCSGYISWLIHHTFGVTIPDGSVQQHGYCHHTMTDCAVGDGHLNDDVLRFAFLPPIGDEQGHVMLVFNGSTMESHGHKGPDRREWGICHFMGECDLYEVTQEWINHVTQA